MKPQSTNDLVHCILESIRAALVAVVFNNFPKNKCNFLHKNKLDTVRCYYLYNAVAINCRTLEACRKAQWNEFGIKKSVGTEGTCTVLLLTADCKSRHH